MITEVGLIIIALIIIAVMSYVIWRYGDQKLTKGLAAGAIVGALAILGAAIRLLWLH